MKAAFVALVLLALCACAASTRHAITLPSGEDVLVLSESDQSFVNVSHVKKHIFAVDYISAYDMDDIPALRKEASEVFDYYRERIDKGGFTTVGLAPMARVAGSPGPRDLYGRPIVFERGADGQWMMQP
ncbi:MAG: hypothetical protein JO194_07350 [Candidatus Eremiobacteraeota bacterium]|nr:hypothetical protein [Candidatus Eremiobacteraeota bacterium]